MAEGTEESFYHRWILHHAVSWSINSISRRREGQAEGGSFSCSLQPQPALFILLNFLKPSFELFKPVFKTFNVFSQFCVPGSAELLAQFAQPEAPFLRHLAFAKNAVCEQFIPMLIKSFRILDVPAWVPLIWLPNIIFYPEAVFVKP